MADSRVYVADSHTQVAGRRSCQIPHVALIDAAAGPDLTPIEGGDMQ